MANIVFEKTMKMGDIQALLRKDLDSKISVEIKKNRIVVVQDSSKGCIILLGEKDGRTSAGLSGYMPSGGLRAAITIPPFVIWFFLIFSLSQTTNFFVIVMIGAVLPLILITIMKAPSQELVRKVEQILSNRKIPIESQEVQIKSPEPKANSCPKCGYTPRYNDRTCRKCGQKLR